MLRAYTCRADDQALANSAAIADRMSNNVWELASPGNWMTVLRVVPIITVADVAAASEAYVQTLGLREVMNHGWIVTLAGPDGRDHQISLLTRDLTAAVNPTVSIEVDDVDAAHAAAVSAGLAIVHPLTDEAWGVRRFFFVDPSGNVVNVLSNLE